MRREAHPLSMTAAGRVSAGGQVHSCGHSITRARYAALHPFGGDTHPKKGAVGSACKID
jgi:hypothetical protein